MSNAVDFVIADARKHLGEVQVNENQCAAFVSRVFAETGNTAVLGGSSGRVGTLVAQVLAKSVAKSAQGEAVGATVSTNLSTAIPGDLIVFGAAEHVMIYTGAGMVIGTSGVPPQKTIIVEVPMESMSPKPTMVLRTGIFLATSGVGGQVTAVATGLASAASGFLADPLGALFGWIPGFAVNGGILLASGVLVFVGLRQVLADDV